MKTLAVFLSLVLDAARCLAQDAATEAKEYFVPGYASWLGGLASWDGTPSNYSRYYPITYVVFGQAGQPIVRSIVGEDDDCPIPRRRGGGDGADFGMSDGAQIYVHATGDLVGNNALPYKFPVKVCSITVEVLSAFRTSLDEGDVVLSYAGQTFPVPRVKLDPKRFLLTGDTGLRSKPKDVGLGDCSDSPLPTVYGIPQCPVNFTEADLNVQSKINNHTNPNITGDYQGNDGWFFKDLADDAATREIDLIVYVGDYIYRQGPCPIDNGQGMNCSGINTPWIADAADVPHDVTVNFVPGVFGDNWYGWWADFFWPAMRLLQSAPIIPTRGNHEECGRGGYGYFFFLSPFPLCPYQGADCTAANIDNACDTYNPPYSVAFEHESFLIVDDNDINPLKGGTDSFTFIEGACPAPPPEGEFIVPVQQTRVDEPQAGIDVAYFSGVMSTLEAMSAERDTNFFVTHHPILAIACNDTEIIVEDWTLQQALHSNTLDRVSAIISGHQHWLQVLEFNDDALPAQLVVGHGGTKLIPNWVNQDSLTRIKLEVGQPELNIVATVKRGITMSQFGYGIMERNDGMDYDVTFYGLDETTRKVGVLDFSMTIPKGPRVPYPLDTNDSPSASDLPSGTSANNWKTLQTMLLAFRFVIGLFL
ncbi:hypothetical protein ACHAW5_006087 [Stephanodiscus triporus]|uniref:Calcineurin-like phosphoesterase domain-containing protein n=1 Tax=Stephanodiscus triporus TaxID=2934178 RepID=A0ABD3MPA1_9STRA